MVEDGRDPTQAQADAWVAEGLRRVAEGEADRDEIVLGAQLDHFMLLTSHMDEQYPTYRKALERLMQELGHTLKPQS
jgi:hypothetical protein